MFNKVGRETEDLVQNGPGSRAEPLAAHFFLADPMRRNLASPALSLTRRPFEWRVLGETYRHRPNRLQV